MANLPEVVSSRDANSSDTVGRHVSSMLQKDDKRDLQEAGTKKHAERDLLSLAGANVMKVEKSAWKCGCPKVRSDGENSSGNGDALSIETVARLVMNVHLQKVPIVVQWLAHEAVGEEDAERAADCNEEKDIYNVHPGLAERHFGHASVAQEDRALGEDHREEEEDLC